MRTTLCAGLRALCLVIAVLGTMTGIAMSGTNDRALLDAAARGDAAAVAALLSSGADVDARDGRGRTALLLATHADHVEAARLLIETGADVNAKDDIHDSPYLYAGARGHLPLRLGRKTIGVAGLPGQPFGVGGRVDVADAHDRLVRARHGVAEVQVVAGRAGLDVVPAAGLENIIKIDQAVGANPASSKPFDLSRYYDPRYLAAK